MIHLLTRHKPLKIILVLLLITVICGGYYLINVMNTNSPAQQETITDSRSNAELMAVIVETYPILATEIVTVVDVYHPASQWYVVTTHEKSMSIPFKYILFDDRPHSDRLVVTGTGIVHPDLPQAANIPDDILDKVMDKGY